jgi:hypothetical protein
MILSSQEQIKILKIALRIINSYKIDENIVGLCSIISAACSKYVDEKGNALYLGDIDTTETPIVRDSLKEYIKDCKRDLSRNLLLKIEKVNNAKFSRNCYYSPFCKKEKIDIVTKEDVILWYENRISAVQKTIDFLEN